MNMRGMLGYSNITKQFGWEHEIEIFNYQVYNKKLTIFNEQTSRISTNNQMNENTQDNMDKMSNC